MKSPLAIILVLAICLITIVFAVELPEKSVIVSFPPNTPAHIMTEAMGAIVDAGGMITHEYKIFKYVTFISSPLVFAHVSQGVCSKGFFKRA
jgi:hypothetical protein